MEALGNSSQFSSFLKHREYKLAKERRRNGKIKDAFSLLQSVIPNIPPTKKGLSKIQTLQLAIKYIEYLQALIEPENGEIPEDFNYTVRSVLTIRNSYSKRAEMEHKSVEEESVKQDVVEPENPKNPVGNVGVQNFYWPNFSPKVEEPKNVEPINQKNLGDGAGAQMFFWPQTVMMQNFGLNIGRNFNFSYKF